MSDHDAAPWGHAYQRQYEAVQGHLAEAHIADDGADPPRAYFAPREVVVDKEHLAEYTGYVERHLDVRGLAGFRRQAPFGYAADNAAPSRSPVPFAVYRVPSKVDARDHIGESARPGAGPEGRAQPHPVHPALCAVERRPAELAEDPGAPEGDAGAGQWVGVVDTGLWAPHPWFPGHVGPLSAMSVDGEGWSAALPPEAGHGTFVAGLVRQVAPGARIAVAGPMDAWGYATDADIAAAVAAQIQANMRIVNLSVGGYTVDDRPPPALAAVMQSLPPDVAIVAAAGNKAASRPLWPAALSGVLAVGAIDRAGGEPASCNRGEWVDACAPGVDVISTYFGSRADPAVVTLAATGDDARFTGFASWSGTSFAAPRLAGAIALEVSRSGDPPRVAAARLLSAGRVVRGLGTEFRAGLGAG